YQRVLKRTPLSAAAMMAGRLPTDEDEMNTLLRAFPGDPRVWGVLAQIHFTNRKFAAAWASLQRARRLEPEDSSRRHGELMLVVDAQPKRAPAVLEAAYREILMRGNADLCFGFVAGAAKLGRRRKGREWLERAVEIATLGMSYPPLHPLDRPRFLAFR